MRPFTDDTAKTLLPIHGIPFAHYQLSWLAAHGVTEIVYSIGHLGEQIRAFAGDGSRWCVSVRYVDEGESRLGTGGALRLCADSGVLDERFFLIYGDSFLPLDLRDVWSSFSRSEAPALMTVFRNFDRWDRSNVVFDGERVVVYDKKRSDPSVDRWEYIDYGLTGWRLQTVKREIPGGTRSDLADVLQRLAQRGDLAGYEVMERFYEIGSPSGLRDFEQWLGRGELHWLRKSV